MLFNSIKFDTSLKNSGLPSQLVNQHSQLIFASGKAICIASLIIMVPLHRDKCEHDIWNLHKRDAN